MPKQFDATLKDLGGDYPTDYATAFDRPPTDKIEPINIRTPDMGGLKLYHYFSHSATPL